MCDTMICLPATTGNKSVIFAKNSDREPTEAQAIAIVPRKSGLSGMLKTTYIEIPQAPQTNACILSRPFQMWGAEMGVNEHGLAIGNEAVFTKIKFDKSKPGLTGMDMLRLALERTARAGEAKDLIVNLLENYGQDACGGYKNRSFYYHNSFLIADAQEAFVLETAGRHWAVERVKAFRTISNMLSIGAEYDEISVGTAPAGAEGFHFAKTFSDLIYTTVGRGARRRACTSGLIGSRQGSLVFSDFFDILSTHHLPDENFTPGKANTADICMHATGLLNPSDTTGSMVAETGPSGHPQVWVTGTSHPCMSVFFPVFFGMSQHSALLEPTGKADASLWWTAKRAHQRVFKNAAQLMSTYKNKRAALQQELLAEYAELFGTNAADAVRAEQYSRSCMKRIMDFYEEYL